MKVKKEEKDDNLLQKFGPQNPLLLTLVPKSIKALGVLSKRGLDIQRLSKYKANKIRCTSVDPVNDTLFISMCWDIADPAVGPKPEMMLTTPGGKPACKNKEENIQVKTEVQL